MPVAALRVVLAGLALLVLASCRTVPPQTGAILAGPGADAPWPEQRAALRSLDRYALDGRVAVAANGQGFSASLRYAQASRHSEFSLEGPLGIGGVRARWDESELYLATSRGEKLSGAQARAELERRLGFALPLEQLRWWLLGIPAPGEAQVNARDDGEIQDFAQDGWTVRIQSRAPGLGFALPQRLTAEREGARFKLLISNWK